MRWMLVLAAATACRDVKPDARPTANASSTPTSPAERELARRLELDYRSPMRERWLDEEEPQDRELFTSMCENGDPAACLRASKKWPSVIGYIAAYCRAGDELSCRYDRWSRSEANAPYPSLSSAELRRGCAAGFSAECDALLGSTSTDDVRFAADTVCRYEKRECERAAEIYLRDTPRDAIRARYLLELDCQSNDLTSCQRLLMAYRAREFAEPIPGRAADLHRFLCGQRNAPFCAAADTRCNEWREAMQAPNACPAEVRNPLGP